MAKKILIIDDDADFTEACKIFLEASGYQVAFEIQEREAIDKVRSFKPDVIILDIKMQTETGGFDIADKIREDPELYRIPVVFLTGYFQRVALSGKEGEVIQRWQNVKGVLDKPVKPAVVLALIHQIES
ncbi:MAG: response regulator [Candidatus Omnitrophica bacterium]|nr:response regulator [Candidatus Omnitrophota bacterium]MDD5672237.1 response regulator [Candidatus Omnitrophota bacterium]